METAAYRVAGIDVHKKMLAVVVADVASHGEWQFEQHTFGALPSDLRSLAAWLAERRVREVVMESTAQYWMPVWRVLEGQFQLHLAQAQSNRARPGRKRDFVDAERLVRRFVAGELMLSFVPDAEQRLWRTLTRTRYQLTCDRTRLQNQLEALLEDAQIKLSSCLSDLLGLSSRRILQGLADGETDPARLASLAAPGLRAPTSQLCDALLAARTMSAPHRQILGLALDRLALIEQQRETLQRTIADALKAHEDAVARLAQVPGFGILSAQQVVAEVGPRAAAFPCPAQLASWVGVCPGRQESAAVSVSDRSPKGNGTMRRVLTQVALAAVKTKGCIFQTLYRRLTPRLGHAKAIWAVAHRLCRLTWLILHQGVAYQEKSQQSNLVAARLRTNRLVRQLQALGYQVQLTVPAQA
jgi:transposase